MKGEGEQNQTTTSTVPQLKNLIKKICQALDVKEETGQSLSEKEFDERVEGWAAEGKKMLLHNKELIDKSDYKEFDDCFKNWEETNCFSRQIKARVLAASGEVRMAAEVAELKGYRSSVKSKSSENILNDKISDVEKGYAILNCLQNTDPRVRALEQNPSWISDEMKPEVTNRAIIEIGNWEKMSGLLKIYKERESHCNVPRSHKEDGKNLGVWLNSQRTRKKKGELDISLIERLEDIGVIWDVFKERWANNYRLLVKFQQREGHANVPQRQKEEGVNVGKWLNDQRQQKKKRKLDVSREKLLDKIGVVWSRE